MHRPLALAAILAGLALPAAHPLSAATGETAVAETAGKRAATYDLLFRQGTLDGMEPGAVLHYSRDVSNRANPEAASRDSGDIALSFESGDMMLANLQFNRDGKHRNLGSFPASVGNPMIMYFYESVIRDMAETAGGSPYYIRNRVKEALVRPAEITEGSAKIDGKTVPTRTIILRPFRDDPNRARMAAFGDLELRVTMSDAVPGWYHSLVAEAPGASGSDPAYRSELRFVAVGAE